MKNELLVYIDQNKDIIPVDKAILSYQQIIIISHQTSLTINNKERNCIMENKNLTGYPSIDKPWLKYYSKEAVSAKIPECSIFEYVWQNNKDHLDDIALIFYNKKITYGELFKKIDIFAKCFLNIGVKCGDLVTLIMLNQPETVYCLYALNKIGAIASFVNVLSSSKEIEDYLNKEQSSFLLVLDLFYDKAISAIKNTKVKKVVWLSLFESLSSIKQTAYRIKVKKPKDKDASILSFSDFICNANTDLNNDYIYNKKSEYAVIGHTGGTTGFPKGVMLSDRAINAISLQYSYVFQPFSRQEIFLNEIVPFAVYGFLINIHIPLSLGLKLILIPKVNPKKSYKLLIKYRPNFVSSVPMYWTSLLDMKRTYDFSFLKVIAAGGAGLSIEQFQKINAILKKCNSRIKLMAGYGMSEVGATACAQLNNDSIVGSVGIPLPLNTIAIFDPNDMTEKKYNELGEICILSPSLMIGYIGDKGETDNVVKIHSDGQRWMHSGDLGYIDENGNVFVEGRIKRIYITEHLGSLSKIFPERIEKTILKNDNVVDCCVVCSGSTADKYIPYAFIEIYSEVTDKISIVNNIKTLCAKELPEYSQPVEFIILDKMPLTPIGKVDYLALEKIADEKNN